MLGAAELDADRGRARPMGAVLKYAEDLQACQAATSLPWSSGQRGASRATR